MEIILSIAALQKGLYTVVAASLLGSILSNLLLVLGESVGSWEFQEWCWVSWLGSWWCLSAGAPSCCWFTYGTSG